MKRRSYTRTLSRILPPVFQGQGLPSLVFIFFALFLFLFSSLRPGNLQTMRVALIDVFAPALATVNRPVQAAADYARAVSGLAALQEENGRLRQENEKLLEWYQRAIALQSENESLQSLLHVAVSPQSRYATARIIADSGNTYAQTVLVLAGGKNGVAKGHAVLSGDGLLGRVIEAGDVSARVLLITDINARVPVFIEGGNIRAIAAGAGGDRLALLHVPPETVLPEGARVMTSGHGGLFPYGLPVGTVVRNADGRPAVRPFADVDRTIHVRIVDAGADPNLRSGP